METALGARVGWEMNAGERCGETAAPVVGMNFDATPTTGGNVGGLISSGGLRQRLRSCGGQGRDTASTASTPGSPAGCAATGRQTAPGVRGGVTTLERGQPPWTSVPAIRSPSVKAGYTASPALKRAAGAGRPRRLTMRWKSAVLVALGGAGLIWPPRPTTLSCRPAWNLRSMSATCSAATRGGGHSPGNGDYVPDGRGDHHSPGDFGRRRDPDHAG
jgi:hypothetical protein